VHGEDVFVDEPEPDEGLGGADAAGDTEVLSRLCFLPAHRVGQLLVVVDDEQFGVRPRDGLFPVVLAEGWWPSQRRSAARDGHGQVPDLRTPASGDEGKHSAQRDGHRDSGAMHHGRVDDGRVGHVSGQPGCGEPGQPRDEQAGRSGELGGPTR
jgi:hypothetical protein